MAVVMSNAGTVITVPWAVQMKINNEKRIMTQSLKQLEKQNEETMRMLNRQQQLAIKKKHLLEQKLHATSKRRSVIEIPNVVKVVRVTPRSSLATEPEPASTMQQAPLSTSARYRMAMKDHEVSGPSHLQKITLEPKQKLKKLTKVHFNTMLLSGSTEDNTKKMDPRPLKPSPRPLRLSPLP